MAKTAVLNIRIDPELKSRSEQLYSNFGMTLTEAVTIFLHKSLMVDGLPFNVRQPRFNKATEEAMEEARKIMSGEIESRTYSSADELFTELRAKSKAGTTS